MAEKSKRSEDDSAGQGTTAAVKPKKAGEKTPKKTELRTVEANQSGLSLLLVTHKERAELYQEQFQSKGLTVTIEPAEQG